MNLLDDFLHNASQYLQGSPLLAVAAVFLGGVVTATNPCVLAMIPLMMGYVAGQREEKIGPARAFLHSLVFVVGLSITFTILGIIAALAGTLYGGVSPVWNWIVAGVCLVMGLHLLGILHFTIPMPFKVNPKVRGIAGALLLGLLFGVVSTPCAAPILVVLLTYLAGTGASVPYGALLLLVYGLGHSVLILLAGTSMGAARKLIESKNITTATGILRKVAGGVILVVGGYFSYLGLK